MTLPPPKPPSGTAESATDATPSDPSRALLQVTAAVSVAAAVIHFGFAPARLAQDWAHGTFLFTVAWFQLAWAVVAYRRGTPLVLLTGAVVNALVIAVWAVSRTVGLPYGAGADGQADAVAFAEVAATVLEGAIVAAALTLVAVPRWSASRGVSVSSNLDA